MSWSVLAGGSAGAGHDRAGTSSQDAHAVAEVAGTLVVAVADGAGSAPFAAAGAALAVRLAQRETAGLLRERPAGPDALNRVLGDSARRTLRRFHRSVTALAHGARAHPRDFATTLTVVVARPPWIGAFAVGDGFVVTRSGDGEFTLLLAPPGGSGRPLGATTLMPVRFGRPRATRRVSTVGDLTGIAAGTDGLETLMIEFAGSRPVRPAAEPFGRLFALADDPGTDPSALNRILAGPRVGNLSSDDRTLVLAVPR